MPLLLLLSAVWIIKLWLPCPYYQSFTWNTQRLLCPSLYFCFCGLLALPPIVLSCCTDFWSSSSSTYIVLDIIPGHFGPLSGRYVIALWILIKPWLPCSLKLKKRELRIGHISKPRISTLCSWTRSSPKTRAPSKDNQLLPSSNII